MKFILIWDLIFMIYGMIIKILKFGKNRYKFICEFQIKRYFKL